MSTGMGDFEVLVHLVCYFIAATAVEDGEAV